MILQVRARREGLLAEVARLLQLGVNGFDVLDEVVLMQDLFVANVALDNVPLDVDALDVDPQVGGLVEELAADVASRRDVFSVSSSVVFSQVVQLAK